MSGNAIVSFGQTEHERLEFVFDSAGTLTERSESDTWLDATVSVQVSTFRGHAKVSITAGDFARLLPQLRSLHESLRGSATFETLERQIGFTVTGDGRGHISLQGSLGDRFAQANRIEFTLAFDQTLLGQSILQIDQAFGRTPTRLTSGETDDGRPAASTR